MKKNIQDTKIKQEDISKKQAKIIYLSVLLFVVVIFSIGLYNILGGSKNIKGMGYLDELALVADDDFLDTDGDGYLDRDDEDPYNWNVGPRDLLMFATLAYEPANFDNLDGKTKIIKHDKDGDPLYLANGDYAYTTVSSLGKVNYVCEDAKNNDLGKCMIKESQMIGMQAQTKFTLGGITFNRWQQVGRDYYFAGLNAAGKTEYYASIDEVNQWAIIDYVSEPTVDKIKDKRLFEATTFRLDNNIVIAFRGTDFPDLLEWFADLRYTVNYIKGYEEKASEYAKKIIKKYVDEYMIELQTNEDAKAPKFYLTGHSLGGYLAQTATVDIIRDTKFKNKAPSNNDNSSFNGDLLNPKATYIPFEDVNYKEYIEDVIYFNGMGLEVNRLSEEKKEQKRFEDLKNWSMNVGEFKDGKEHKVICYNLKGDFISAMGKHVEQISFYSPEGAVKRHMQDNAGIQLVSRNKLIKFVTKIIFDIGNFVTNARFKSVYDYLDYYDKVYGKKQTISFFDMLWFTHEPSAGLFYNIKQGTRGGDETIRITQSILQRSLFKTTIEFRAEVSAPVKEYIWYKNNKKVQSGSSDSLIVTRTIGNTNKIKDAYTVSVEIDTNKSNKKDEKNTMISSFVNIDTKKPTGKMKSSTWQVKRNKTFEVQIVCEDESEFSDNIITTNDITVNGLIKNLKVEKVSAPIISNDGRTTTWIVTLKGNIIGITTISLKAGSVADIFGNYNNLIVSPLIKVTLL